jgi:peptide/nickel transport system substrate-binding protein
MFTTTMTQPDPERFMEQFCTWEVATKANKWQGRNITRWSNAEYDKAYRSAESELDPVKRAALFIRMNDLVIGDNVVISVAFLPRTSGVSTKLVPVLSGFDNDLFALYDWYREA